MLLILLAFLITGCTTFYEKSEQAPKQITEPNLTDLYAPELDDDLIDESPQIEPMKSPKIISKNFHKKISINITEMTEIKQALAKVASDIGINLIFKPLSSEKITFIANNEEFLSIVKDLSNLLNWHYKISNNKIIIQNDEPYFKIYDVHFLNISRETNSVIATSSNILSSKEDSQSASDLETNSSTSVVNSNSMNNFWSELEINIKSLLDTQGTLSFHKQAGLIVIKAKHKTHNKIKKYLEQLKEACSAQVLIEAKILEVSLHKEFSNGINWYAGNSDRSYFATSPNNHFSPIDSNNNLYSIGIQKKSINSIIHFIEKFGSVRTLSNPRITIMNNQTGILKVATQEVYFNLRYDNRYTNSLNSGNRESVYSNIKTIPVGLVFSVHPVIFTKTGEIILTIRPTISRVSEYKDDPGVALMPAAVINKKPDETASPQITNKVPVIEVREMDSVLNMRSGDIVVLGGMMSEKSYNTNSGIPLTSKIPLIKDLTTSSNKTNEISEIVIFLRARIIKNNKHLITNKDKSIYKKFAADNRPLRLNYEKNSKKLNQK